MHIRLQFVTFRLAMHFRPLNLCRGTTEKTQFLEHKHFYTESTVHKLWDETLKIKR
jgi:hypothetical protein